MRMQRTLLAVALMLLASTSVFALDVGYNQDIHNGTGQDAYDFHVEGTLQSAVPPVQIREFCFYTQSSAIAQILDRYFQFDIFVTWLDSCRV